MTSRLIRCNLVTAVVTRLLACLLLNAGPAVVQLKAQVWTDIMTTTGNTDESSGVHWLFNAALGTNPTENTRTSVGTYPTESLQMNGTNVQTSGGYDSSCSGVYRYPQERLESNYGPQHSGTYKGVGFLGSFNTGGSFSGFGGGSYLVESVYFNEIQCYNGGREYGFFYDAYTGHIWAYWEINANISGALINQVDLGTTFLNQTDYFSIWPQSKTGGGCEFNVSVKDAIYENELWGKGPYDVNANNVSITGNDSHFCQDIVSEYGYVTAGTVYSPTITTISSPSSIKLDLSLLYVLK